MRFPFDMVILDKRIVDKTIAKSFCEEYAKKYSVNIPLQNFSIPKYGTPESAGMDLISCSTHQVNIGSGQVEKFQTGIAIQLLNDEVMGAIYPRSGLASKLQLSLANCVGVIDADYTGEIIVALQNNSNEVRIIHPGTRIAQLVLQPIFRGVPRVVDKFSYQTERGCGGFGSTGE